MTFLRNTFSILATTAFITPIRLFTVIALARLFSPEDLGIFTITITFATVSMLLAQLGLPSSAVYRIRRLAYPPSQVAGSVLLTVVALGFIGAVCLFLLETFLFDRIFRLAPVEVYPLGIGIALGQLLGSSFVGVARGMNRFDFANIYNVLLSGGQLVGLIIALGPFDGGLLDALIVVFVVHALSSAYLVVSVIRCAGISLSNWREQLEPSLRYGVKSHAQALAANLHEQIDIFMLAYLISATSEIAIYAVAVGVVNRLKLVPGALADALFPEIAGRSNEEGSALAAQMVRHSFISVLLVAVAIGLLGPIIIPIVFGPVYRDSVPILLVLLPGMVMLTNFVLLNRFFMAIDRQQVSISIQAGAVVLNVALNLVLIPRYGVIGAAVASSISYSFDSLAIIYAFTQATDQSFANCMRFTRADLKIYSNLLGRIRKQFGTGSAERD